MIKVLLNFFSSMIILFLAQTPATFRLVPGHVMNSNQTSNMPIIDPIQVELLDVNGYRVTSGPDASLVSLFYKQYHRFLGLCHLIPYFQ